MSVKAKKYFRASLTRKGAAQKARFHSLHGRKRSSPNAVTLAAMDNALTGHDMHGPFDSVEALMADLNA